APTDMRRFPFCPGARARAAPHPGHVPLCCLGLPLQPLQIRQVLLALLHPSLVARLVLCADEAVRTAATMGYRIEVASRIADRVLDVRSARGGGLEHPRP